MTTEQERFSAKYEVNELTGCWIWRGAKSPSKSGKWPYGVFTVGGKLGMAHRFSYEAVHGKIKRGLVLDHLCRNTLCVNPKHLEPVTFKKNINRGVRHCSTLTHCPRGHAYEGENLYLRKDGHRECRICRTKNWHEWAIKNGRKVRKQE